jgi:hypothetical protein
MTGLLTGGAFQDLDHVPSTHVSSSRHSKRKSVSAGFHGLVKGFPQHAGSLCRESVIYLLSRQIEDVDVVAMFTREMWSKMRYLISCLIPIVSTQHLVCLPESSW